MVHSPAQRQIDPRARRRPGRRAFRKLDKRTASKHAGGVAGALIGGLIRSLAAKLILASVLAILAYFGLTKVAHLASPFNPHTALFKPHETITTSAVMTRLTEIEQVHVATANYQVKVNITQSVGIIPCFLVCNKMQLQGTGTDDAILDLSTLSQGNVEVNASRSSVTLWIPPPTIGPAILDPAKCDITSSHGIANTLTQGIRNNPNGYRPLFVEGETQIHGQALRDSRLLAAGEQSARQLLSRILGTIGVKQVTVDFV
jgi:hypothetical protein